MATPSPTTFESTRRRGFFVLEQRLHEPGAAGDQDDPVDLLLQLADLFGDVASEHGRVVPFGLFQSRRDDVLGHAVHLLREADFVGDRRPGPGKALVRHAPQQLGVGLAGLVELELVALLSPADLEAPAAVLEALGAARVLHDAVQ